MTQADRDRLVTLKKAKKKLITQAEAAAELQLSESHVKRLLKKLRSTETSPLSMGCVDRSRIGKSTGRSGKRR